VTDPTLRLPTTIFHAVLDLGDLPLKAPKFPRGLGMPALDVDWDADTATAVVYIHFDGGQLHLEATAQGIEHHFHAGDGSDVRRSPWSTAHTAHLLAWAIPFSAHLAGLLPTLLEDIEQAAQWHDAGLTVYSRDFGPVPLQIIHVEVEGEQMMLPWLGSGHVTNEHEDGEDHPIVLLWAPETQAPTIPIAHAWLDRKSGEPKAKAVRGVNWVDVGMSKAEVLDWLGGLYLNHHLIADPQQLILEAALDRIAGFDE
jgi:hypothetical protein